MALLRAGLVLFVSVTLLAVAIMYGAYALMGIPRDPLDLFQIASPLIYTSIVTLPTCAVLAILAWRGRRQPLSDGIAIMTVIALSIATAAFVRDTMAPSIYPDAVPAYIYLVVCMQLIFLIVAYAICYLGLRWTPLLRGLAPERPAPRQ